MTARYYAPQLSDAETCELEGSEFHHLARVMRAAVGDRIILFDGSGLAAEAEIVELAKTRAALCILSRHTETLPAGCTVVLATAIPKADRFRWLVEKATELGVDRLVPLQTARSVTEPGSNKLDKMRATVIEACKQSGRNRLMAIEPLTPWESFLSGTQPNDRLFVADPGGIEFAGLRKMRQDERQILLAVGPEGGFTEAEISQAVQAGGSCISLGPRILRTETAAVALSALCLLPMAS
jgi:16S rRNA (uracil1498-N3)-methyltransferase